MTGDGCGTSLMAPADETLGWEEGLVGGRGRVWLRVGWDRENRDGVVRSGKIGGVPSIDARVPNERRTNSPFRSRDKNDIDLDTKNAILPTIKLPSSN